MKKINYLLKSIFGIEQDRPKPYVLLDLAGNIEREKEMTDEEAKRANDFILENEERLIRWVDKSRLQKLCYESS